MFREVPGRNPLRNVLAAVNKEPSAPPPRKSSNGLVTGICEGPAIRLVTPGHNRWTSPIRAIVIFLLAAFGFAH
jgi:hypothetical protein